MIPALLLFAQQTPPQRVSSLAGTIETLAQFESKHLGNKRNIRVYLPPQYATEPNRKFPVLYMHDGQNVFDGATSFIPNQEWRADEAAEMLIKSNFVEPLIIIAIDNGEVARADEYLHKEIRMGAQRGGGKAALYGKFVVEEVMKVINIRY
ncbi:MAG TPA: alpha/beta hydrolase-fold protein, partial [Fimbriimonas sp.]|nr:alpha/beta hydrolase-fold protein [Fimbriimonas sp.]